MRVIVLRRSLVALSSLAILASAAAGCSSSTGNEPPGTGAPRPSETPTNTLPHSGAPKVGAPVADTAAFEGEPCTAVTDQQFQSINLKVRRAEPDTEFSAGPGCDWSFAPVGIGSVNGSFMTANTEGLSNLYAKDQAGEWGFFKDAGALSGHPAVFASSEDERGKGRCDVEIGLRDDLTYHVGVSATSEDSPLFDDPCGAAKKVAGLVIKTLKGGA